MRDCVACVPLCCVACVPLCRAFARVPARQAQLNWRLGEKPLCTCSFAQKKGRKHDRPGYPSSRLYGGPGQKPKGGHEAPCEQDILTKAIAAQKKQLGSGSSKRKRA